MKLNRLTFNKNRLKCLNTETVQGRSTVQHNGMLFNDILEDIPYPLIEPFHHLLRILNVMGLTGVYQLFHNERLKELNRHLFRHTALINLQFRSYDDNGTSGVVYTLSEKVLTETTLLSL